MTPVPAEKSILKPAHQWNIKNVAILNSANMLFFPVGCLIFLLFILFLPVLFILGYFHIVTIGFEKLGFSPEATILILLAILIGSGINIPLGRQKLVRVEEPVFFGLFRQPKTRTQGVAINLGGAVIPVLISFYFFIWFGRKVLI